MFVAGAERAGQHALAEAGKPDAGTPSAEQTVLLIFICKKTWSLSGKSISKRIAVSQAPDNHGAGKYV